VTIRPTVHTRSVGGQPGYFARGNSRTVDRGTTAFHIFYQQLTDHYRPKFCRSAMPVRPALNVRFGQQLPFGNSHAIDGFVPLSAAELSENRAA